MQTANRVAVTQAMILTCPACDTAFKVRESAVTSKGRKVRCSACGHAWLATRLPVPVSPRPAEPVSESQDWQSAPHYPGPHFERGQSRSEARVRLAGAEPPQGQGMTEWQVAEQAEREQHKRPRRRKLFFLLLLLFIPLLAWLGREQIVRSVPGTSGLYAALGVEVASPLDGLSLQNINLLRRSLEGRDMVVVEGTVSNDGDRDVALPPLRAHLLDRSGNRVRSWTFEAERSRLAAGDSVLFHTQAEDTPDAVTIDLDFLDSDESGTPRAGS